MPVDSAASRKLIDDMVKQASALPQTAQHTLVKQWRKREQEHAGFAEQFDKNAQFTNRDLSLAMVELYRRAAEALQQTIQEPES